MVIGTIPAGVTDDVGDEGGISESSDVCCQTTDPMSHTPVSDEMLRFQLAGVIHKSDGRPQITVEFLHQDFSTCSLKQQAHSDRAIIATCKGRQQCQHRDHH